MLNSPLIRCSIICAALTLLLNGSVLCRDAIAQDGRSGDASQDSDAGADQQDPNAAPAPPPSVGPWAPELPTSSKLSPLFMGVLLLLWFAVGDWVNRDSQIHSLGYRMWNPIVFFPFLAITLLLVFIPVTHWIRLVVMLVVFLGVVIPYIVVHNKSVEAHQTVLTPSWWRYAIAGLLGKVGVKVDTERKADWEKGEPIDLIAMGGASATEDQANLLTARHSPGYLLVKELLVELIHRGGIKVVLDYGPQAVNVKHEIDGVWHPAEPRDRESGDVLLAVMKTLANLQAQERRRKQAGKFGAKHDGVPYMCHLVTQGIEGGERAILTMHSEKARPQTYEELGLREALQTKWGEFMAMDRGFVVFAALPGDGLTTLTDASLDETDRLMRDFIAIEDAAKREHEIQNINVRTYDTAKGETATKIIPAVAREYPNVYIMRDIDAEAGALLLNEIEEERLVITTIRAKDASDALIRLIANKLPQKQLASVTSAVLYQRLIRKLCPECKVGYQPPPDVLKKLGIPAGKVQQLFRPPKPEEVEKPCKACGEIGYRGRTGIFELLEVTDEMRDILAKQPNADLLRKAMRSASQRSLQEEGILLVAKGVTSLPELMRVLKK